MKKFALTEDFLGYRNKTDQTKLEGGYLVKGSQNVISTDGDRIAIRKGYTLYGAANTALTPIESSYEWTTARGLEIPLRSYDDELEIEYGGTWYRLKDSWTNVDFVFSEYWDAGEVQDALLFVNGDSNIYYWSGGITTFASATSNTITKQGTSSWAEEGFILGGTTQVVIDGTTYTYTGGESTTTLTGVTPDPTSAGHTAGDLVVQAVRTTSNTPTATGQNDFIAEIDNQIYVGSAISRLVYVSEVNDYTNYVTGTAPGDPVNLTLAGTCKGFAVQEDVMYISAGLDQWYQVHQELSADFTTANVTVKRLKTGSLQSAQSQDMITKIKNDIVFISQEPTLDLLGRVENVDTPQQKSLSDPIKLDFDNYDFTNAHIRYYRNNVYIAVPAESLVLIYNIERGYWEAPQVLPARRIAVIDGELYIHSNAVPETYKLFDGRNDNEAPINAIARFSYRNYGARAWLKSHDEWYSEGYIAPNTTLDLTLRYEYEGSKQTTTYEIDGGNEDIIFESSLDASLGKAGLGKMPLGSTTESSSTSDLPNKFRIKHEMIPERYFEIQPEYSSNGTDYNWELLAFGSNVITAPEDSVEIKQ